VIALEQSCVNAGDACCRFISRLETEWSADDAHWTRQALRMESVEADLKRRDDMVDTAQRAARSAQSALASMSRRLKTELLLDNLVLQSEVMHPVESRARQVSQTDVPVLLVGEPGTGKASFARAIHYAGPRRGGPFETVDCRGLTASALQQELAGFLPGAFPGALRAHQGLLVRAKGGTIYLDEVTALSSETQGLLLRAIERGEISPLGGSEPFETDARVIAATQFDPLEKLATGEFREDLYYALAVGRVDVPPLRMRADDILRIAQTFLTEACERFDKPVPRMGDDFSRVIRECSWPGNLRQLRNVIEHALLFARNEELVLADLPEEVIAARWARPPQDLSADIVRAVLKRTRGNRSEAAKVLGVGRTTLWRAMKRMGID
jgi:two-component system NtrC family response regulator